MILKVYFNLRYYSRQPAVIESIIKLKRMNVIYRYIHGYDEY